MKRFNLRGQSANWDALKVEAHNTKTDERENRSEIPYGHKITVHVVNNFYRVYDRNVRQILYGEISDADTDILLNRLVGKHRPDYVLFHEGHVVGFANIHRRRWFRRQQEEAKKMKTYNLDVLLRSHVSVEAHSFEEAKEMVEQAVANANEYGEEAENLSVISVEEI